MLIECEKCHTTYVLDDKLIPPQGAPVQCTRCGHVFTARAPQAPAPTQLAPAPAVNKTVMFGVPGADGPAPSAAAANAPANRTMMFGAPGGEAPPPPAANKTVMFGAPASDAAAPAAANRTMMFGAPGSGAPPAPASAAPAPTNRTMMFGAPGAEASAGAPATNRTMMFGVPGAGPVPEPPSQTAPTQPANKTMMFGAGGVDVPPAQPNPRSTMMFGAVPPQNLGAAPPQQAPAQQRPASQTMMFGAPVAPQQPAAPAPAAPPQKATSTTMMFGVPAAAPAPAPHSAPPQSPGPQKSSSTMIFGATPVTGPGPGKAPKLTESTVRIGPEDLERMMREHEALRAADGNMTPSDGSPAVPPAEERQNKTQLFAMADQPEGSTPPSGSDAVGKSQKTQMFAMADLPPEPGSKSGRPRQTLPNKGESSPPPRVDPSILDTFPPDGQPRRKVTPDPEGVHTLMMPAPSDAPAQEKPKERPPSVTLQNAAHNPGATVINDDAPVPGAVNLPPEAPDLMQSAGAVESPSQPTQPVTATEGDPAAALRAQVARRNRIALILIALILVAAAIGVTWKVFGKMLLNRAPPAAAVEGMEKALAQLRFDDTKAKEAAVTQLGTLVQQYPDFVEGHAALVTAVSLQLDDVQQRVRRIEQLVDRKNTLIKRYGTEKSPANWETLAQALTVQVEELIKEHRPLAEQGHDLDTKARAAYKGLETAVARVGDPSKQAKLAALRAQALFHGVSGTDQALVLTKRFETTADGAAPDGWIDLAIPEYAANARVSDELMQQALTKLDELHKRDSTFLRTYVLSARLHLIKKDLEGATTDLDQVLSMRKEHDVAHELREWVRKLPKSDDKDKKEPNPP